MKLSPSIVVRDEGDIQRDGKGTSMEGQPQGIPWFALRVRTVYEALVAGLLTAKGYAPFLPTYPCWRSWSDRIKKVNQPLFPGYLFCQIEMHKRLPVLITPGVMGIVGSGKTPLPVADAEIEALQALVRSGLPSKPCAFLNVGDRVRVNRGALLGVEGTLSQVRSKNRIVLSVSLLQRAVAVEIDSAWVSIIGRCTNNTVLEDKKENRFRSA